MFLLLCLMILGGVVGLGLVVGACIAKYHAAQQTDTGVADSFRRHATKQLWLALRLLPFGLWLFLIAFFEKIYFVNSKFS
jgi:hypothetical protein